MPMNWCFESRQGVGIIELRGYLGDSALARFNGAVGWALARCTGPVVIDLTHLQGCSASGEAALQEAAQRAAARRRVLAICGCPSAAARLSSDGQPVTIPAYADLGTAVTALSPQGAPSPRSTARNLRPGEQG